MNSKKPYHVATPPHLYTTGSPLIWLDLLATPAYMQQLPNTPPFPPAYIVPAYTEHPLLTLRYAIAVTAAITYDDRLILHRPHVANGNLIIQHQQNPQHADSLPEQLILPALTQAIECLPTYILPADSLYPTNIAAVYAAFTQAFDKLKRAKCAITTRNVNNRKVAMNTYYAYVALAAINCINAAITNVTPTCAFSLLADGKIIAACNN